MRKVVELEPALHGAVTDLAHEMRCKVKDLSCVLIAYALEHKDDAIADADRLLSYWEQQPAPATRLHIVRVSTRKP